MVTLLLLALGLRLAFVAATPDYRPAHDDARYDRLACAIAVSGSYPSNWPDPTPRSCATLSRGLTPEPTAFRPPAYPGFLAGVYVVSAPVTSDRWSAARIAQALLGTLLAGLTALVATRIWGRVTGLIALTLAAVAPPLILVGGSLLSDLLFATLVAGAVLAALSADRRPLPLLAVAGALVGLAALTRPNGLLVLAPLAIAAWSATPGSTTARVRAVAVLVLAALTVLAPWTARNHVRMDAVIPISTHTGESLAGTYNEAARARTDHPGAWRPPRQVPSLADVFTNEDEVWRQQELVRRALDFAAGHPGYVVEVSARNTLRMLNLSGSSWWRGNARAMSLPGPAADVAAYGFLPLGLVALLGACLPRARQAPAWLWIVPLLLAASTVPVAGEVRMRAAIDPFLVMLAAVALTRLGRRIGRRGDAPAGARARRRQGDPADRDAAAWSP